MMYVYVRSNVCAASTVAGAPARVPGVSVGREHGERLGHMGVGPADDGHDVRVRVRIVFRRRHVGYGVTAHDPRDPPAEPQFRRFACIDGDDRHGALGGIQHAERMTQYPCGAFVAAFERRIDCG